MARASNNKSIERIALVNGIDLIGVADLSHIDDIRTHPRNLLKDYRYGISLIVALDKYDDAYSFDIEEQIAFPLIRKVSALITDFILERGFEAIALDPNDGLRDSGPLYYRSKLSMKAVARAAGLGWIGKSAVFVSKKFGPRVCLGVVLTDMPLTPGKSSKNECGRCGLCAKACPVGALTATSFEVYPRDLEKVLQREACNDWMENRSPTPGYCWECVLACPKGKRIS
jgi:epoxyqueuosine reductase QueG